MCTELSNLNEYLRVIFITVLPGIKVCIEHSLARALLSKPGLGTGVANLHSRPSDLLW